MKRLTLKEVMEQHGGKLPSDAVLRPDDDELSPPSPARSKAPPAKSTKPTTPNPNPNSKRTGRFASLNAFVDMGMADLTKSQVKVWLILFRDVKAATGTARTGQTDIARRAGVSTTAVKNAVKALKKKRMVAVVHQGGMAAGTSVYRVHPTGR